VSCILLAIIHLFAVKGRIPRRIYDVIFIFNLLLMSATGHYGGNLTHGEGYLFSTGSTEATNDRTPVDSSAIFHSMVMPVLESKCVSCHKADKTKGGLRMDEYARLVKGGKHGPIFVPGDPAQSEMLVRAGLPMDDEKHMPPAKKPQLTAAEAALLHWWVLHGASVTIRIPSDASSNDTLRPFLKESAPAVLTVMDTLPSVSMPDTAIILKLKAAGWSVRPIAQGSPLLDVSAVNISALTNKDVDALMPIAVNILWLDLSGMPVTDASMDILAKCIHLRRLSLKGTRVGTDGIRKIPTLQSLQQLNIVNTPVDEDVLSMLGSLPALERVYAWQTRITPAAAEVFMKNSPRIRLETGYNVKP
jgi:mono/diheme cytochrome c family protein